MATGEISFFVASRATPRNDIAETAARNVYWYSNMLDIEAIETINFEQLVTVTDRLLLRSRAAKRRLSTNKLIFRHELAEASRRSSPALPRLPELPVSPESPDLTQVVKRPPTTFDTTSVFVLGTLLTIALVLASML